MSRSFFIYTRFNLFCCVTQIWIDYNFWKNRETFLLYLLINNSCTRPSPTIYFYTFVSKNIRSTEQQQQPSHQVHKPKSVQLPFCINDSLALAHKHYNQKKIKQIRFLFKHRENCLLQRNHLVKKFQSQPNIYRNWNCEECGLWVNY